MKYHFDHIIASLNSQNLLNTKYHTINKTMHINNKYEHVLTLKEGKDSLKELDKISTPFRIK